MATFSSTHGPEDVCLPCKKGNLFLCEMPQELQDKLQLAGIVNNKPPTPAFTVGKVETLINTADESINKVELMVGGEKRTLIKDLAEFGELKNPADLRVFIGANEPKPENPESIGHRNRTEYAMQNTGEKGIGVFGFEIANLAGLGIGVTDAADMLLEQKIAIGAQLGEIFGIEWNEINWADVNKAYGSVPSGILQEIISLVPEFLDSSSATAAAAATSAGGGNAARAMVEMPREL